MLPHPNIPSMMLALAIYWLVYQFSLRKMQCRYCGQINDHKPHCPYQNSGMTGA
jgi:hypothetical protein